MRKNYCNFKHCCQSFSVTLLAVKSTKHSDTHYLLMLACFIVNLTHARVIWEEGVLTEINGVTGLICGS